MQQNVENLMIIVKGFEREIKMSRTYLSHNKYSVCYSHYCQNPVRLDTF